MYGQTEATARMAYLPPELATRRPDAIGVPIPGGSFRLEPVAECAEPGTGELVYTGPNVMMGYATAPDDLGRGAGTGELRTGDLARVTDGALRDRRPPRPVRQAVRPADRPGPGRAAPVRTRVAVRCPVRCVVADEVLHLFLGHGRTADSIHAAATELCGLPPRAVRVHVLAELPVTASGKPDRAALERQARLAADADRDPAGRGRAPAAHRRDDPGRLRARARSPGRHRAQQLRRARRRLAVVRRAGHPPGRPARRPAPRLAHPADRGARRRGDPAPGGASRWTPPCCCGRSRSWPIVGTHANLFTVVGGAHLLLAVAGFNFARFQLADAPRATRVRHGLVGVAQVVVPSSLFIGVAGLVTGGYTLPTALFLNGVLGSNGWTDQWQFWFLEALVWISLGAVALLAVPAVDRLERRAPLAPPLARPARRGRAALRVDRGGGRVDRALHAGDRAVVLPAGLGRGPVAAPSSSGPLVTRGGGARDRRLLRRPHPRAGDRRRGGAAGVAALPAGAAPAGQGADRARGRVAVRVPHALAGLPVTSRWTTPCWRPSSSLAVGIAYWWLTRPALRRLGRALRATATARP